MIENIRNIHEIRRKLFYNTRNINIQEHIWNMNRRCEIYWKVQENMRNMNDIYENIFEHMRNGMEMYRKLLENT